MALPLLLTDCSGDIYMANVRATVKNKQLQEYHYRLDTVYHIKSKNRRYRYRHEEEEQSQSQNRAQCPFNLELFQLIANRVSHIVPGKIPEEYIWHFQITQSDVHGSNHMTHMTLMTHDS